MTTHTIEWVRKRWQAWQRTYSSWVVDYNQQHDNTVKRLFLLAWIAIVGMPLYYVVWAYWFPQPYENIGLRLFGVALCLPAIFAKHFFKQKWLPIYFFIGLTYVLPFFFTFMYLMNSGSSVWSESLLIALILLFHFDTALAFLAYLAGTSAAYLAYIFLQNGWVPMNAHELAQWPIQIFAILTVSLTKIGRKVLLQQKLEGMSTALATVAHELRTPLLSIDANIRGVKRAIQNTTIESSAEKALTEQAIARVEFEVRYMNNTIDLLLLNASNGNNNWGEAEVLSMNAAVDSVLQRYPFVNQTQRELVSVNVRADFFFQGKTELCSMVLLNLLSNSFKAIHRAGKGKVRIIIDGSPPRNRLFFIDTGCGIDSTRLPLIFKRFYAYPEHTGTGIGLSFCKEVIEAWRGHIHCASKINSHTIFVLEFPQIP
ncbi:MAG: HAMP domain-containing histidine kinase [Gallionella sp.]|nr:HAMP domain-containing histidine kinase [Gallionella sp.]